jgi:hypothetical protein
VFVFDVCVLRRSQTKNKDIGKLFLGAGASMLPPLNATRFGTSDSVVVWEQARVFSSRTQTFTECVNGP